MNKRSQKTQLYIFFWIIIIGLVVLISWFAYLLIKPASDAETTTNKNNSAVVTPPTNNENKNKQKKNNTNKAKANNSNSTTAENTNTAQDEDAANTNEEDGLVEPADENTNTTDNSETEDEEDSEDGTKTVTLYFPKSDSACGEVYAVERKIKPTDDLYGQIILENMHGPTETESDYDNAVTSAIRLRQVEYTAAGPLITLNEGYDELDECQQATVDAQLIKTANAMFDLPVDGAGEVVVGTVETDEAAEDSTAEDTDTESE